MVWGAICEPALVPDGDGVDVEVVAFELEPPRKSNMLVADAPPDWPDVDFEEPSDCNPSRIEDAAPSANHMTELRRLPPGEAGDEIFAEAHRKRRAKVKAVEISALFQKKPQAVRAFPAACGSFFPRFVATEKAPCYGGRTPD